MAKSLVLYDIDTIDVDFNQEKYRFFMAGKQTKPCVGCFGCWLKTPGKCIVNDSDSDFATIMPHVDEVVVISQLVFGGLSPRVKAIFDRSIGFVLPFFCEVEGEMHHVQRYEERPSLKYLLYGDGITEGEKETARKLIKANAVNFGAENFMIQFYPSPEKALEGLR